MMRWLIASLVTLVSLFAAIDVRHGDLRFAIGNTTMRHLEIMPMVGRSACALPGSSGRFPCGPTCTGPYDVQSVNALFLGGFRLENSGYTGSAVTLRRNGDNATKSIGLLGCDFDTATATTFCAAGGSTNCFVTTLFCQIATCPWGNYTQTTAANQPLYVANCQNGHPCMQADGTASYLVASPGGTQVNMTLFVVMDVIANGSNTRVFETSNSCDFVDGWAPVWSTAGSPTLASGAQTKNNAVYTEADFGTPPALSTFFQAVLWQINNATTTYGVDVNQGTAATVSGSTPATAAQTVNSQIFASNCSGVGSFLNGRMAELALYASDLSANHSGIDQNMKSYWGTP